MRAFLALLLAGALLAGGCGRINRPSASTAPVAPTPTPTASPTPQPDVAITSAPLPPPEPPITPTPTPDPAVWRLEGRVTDAGGNPLVGVCVVIGPHGCQRGNPRTDDRGVYFFDVPQNPTVVYDLYFEKRDYAVLWHRIQPQEPTVFNVVLRKLSSPRP